MNHKLIISRLHSQSGFTLVELLLSIGLIMVISAFVMSFVSTYQPYNLVRETGDEIVNWLRVAQGRTMGGDGNDVYGVHFESAKFVLFKGLTYNASDPENVTTTVGGGVEIYAISLNGGGADVLFKRFKGDTDNYGSVKVRLKGDTSFWQVDINEIGRIDSTWNL